MKKQDYITLIFLGLCIFAYERWQYNHIQSKIHNQIQNLDERGELIK